LDEGKVDVILCNEVPNGNLFRIKKWQNFPEIIRTSSKAVCVFQGKYRQNLFYFNANAEVEVIPNL
jgi:hypothetical protein